MINLINYNSLKKQGTYLTKFVSIPITKRFMWSRNRGNIGHANKVLNATNKPPVQATATTFPSNVNKVEEELEANRKLPTGIDFSNNATDQTSTRGYGSSSQNNSGPLGTHNPNHRTTLTTENTQAVPHTDVRYMSAIHTGRLKPNAKRLTTSKGTQPESDLSGKHDLVFAANCSSPACKGQNCATGTDLNTRAAKPNPCGEPPQYHQQPMVPHPVINYEVAGNLTSKIPPNKNGVVVDSTVQANGKKKCQELVTEKNSTLASPVDVKENPQGTAYAQQNDRTEAILKAMPADSTLS